MDINDKELLKEIIKFCDLEVYKEEIKNRFGAKITNAECDNYPLDKDIENILDELYKYLNTTKEREVPYDKSDLMDKLWIKLVDKSIKCLRFFDKREPFQKNPEKHPFVYGINELEKYHKKYGEFEGLLYGSDSYYRDHMFHVIRCWMIGVYCLLTNNTNITTDDTRLIDEMHIEGEIYTINKIDKVLDEYKDADKNEIKENKAILKDPHKISEALDNDKVLIRSIGFSKEINILEKISMWTIIALCHDLGYPLEKSQKILNKTKDMMEVFVSQPKIWSDINFNGIQDSINDYIIKFMSSKMKYNKEESTNKESNSEAKYNGRIQPKYYLKYIKSLERYSHGIISSIIIYKMLLYFIEADTNLNDDYLFDEEDARQFYIRREILRAIASHTCEDIYQMEVTTFTALLFLCDEFQEWGRKSWKNLYTGVSHNAINMTLKKFNSLNIELDEDINMESSNLNQIKDNIVRIFDRQYILYKTTFRDGQYTAKRSFDINKKMNIKIDSNKYTSIDDIKITYAINHKLKDNFKIEINKSGNNAVGIEEENLVNSIDKAIKDFKQKYSDDDITFNDLRNPTNKFSTK